jgi:hypothetical protein
MDELLKCRTSGCTCSAQCAECIEFEVCVASLGAVNNDELCEGFRSVDEVILSYMENKGW